MNEAPIGILLGVLVFLLFLSAFFSSSETGMMALNRYRLRHQARSGHKGAIRTSKLLERPDRLIGVILIGNNFVNILASAIATIVAMRIWGNSGIAIATFGLTLLVLIFGEVTPKTLAALHPERVAFPASVILRPLLKVLYPFVVVANTISNALLKMFGVDPNHTGADQLSQEELRTVVNEAGSLIPTRHKSMLTNILDLENVTVDDIMIPRNEIIGIDIEEDIEDILDQLRTAQHTRLPVYKGDVNNIIGILHMRNVAKLLSLEEINKAALLNETADPYFVPEITPLHTQMVNFQKQKLRSAFVVDEYGDVIGLVTLEDILEEIVGDFTTDVDDISQDITPQKDGTYIIDGTASIRETNKSLDWELPTEGPKTLNGLITEHLEEIPDSGVCLAIGNYRIEILQTRDNVVKTVKAWAVK
ncbi:HlyC/CorC family transporter [Sansalvadorimonas sp. 2012CJ34-2]|uniref:HlyC/CorC family transporter n=1 Tax=Parendozoicomonas callyspongiae TaxID=2942213 RepID=A0ABT0PKT5_9GAMM|nr:HlyC/CorC family transporter [Sansalvadorimonas sp. 2012CJ34-2]MCL6272007.1 HlyC/CorC family transporter [Sansalvadorimonas sp. 2012CJ34-2]